MHPTPLQVALPIPRPTSFRPEDEYKIALSLDGDRHLTSWLTVMSKPLVGQDPRTLELS